MRRSVWWIADYLYAIWSQLRGMIPGRGPEDYRSGTLRPVVVLPGVYERWTFLRPMIEVLHDRGHPVHVLTSIGHNRRPVSSTARQVADFVRDADLRDVVLVAHSKGGLIGKYAMAHLDGEARVAAMAAIATPFSGSIYAAYLVLPSLRAFSPKHETTLLLAADREINASITSIYAAFDPHIPGGSELDGARNIRIETGGHFRILADSRSIQAVVDVAAGTQGPG